MKSFINFSIENQTKRYTWGTIEVNGIEHILTGTKHKLETGRSWPVFYFQRQRCLIVLLHNREKPRVLPLQKTTSAQ